MAGLAIGLTGAIEPRNRQPLKSSP